MSRTEHLVTVDALAAELETSAPPVLLDVRWRLFDEPEAGWRGYLDQHLPGARFLDMERVLTGHTGNPREGRHPLPDLETLVAGLRELGVSANDDLVVYDDPGSFAADRAWWVLRWVGLRARVLDGGLPAWVAAAAATESGNQNRNRHCRAGPRDWAVCIPGSCPALTPMRPPASPGTASWWTAGRRTGTAANTSPWTRVQVTSPVQSTSRRRRCSPTTATCLRTTCCTGASRGWPGWPT